MFLLVCAMLIIFPEKSAQGAREGIEMALKIVIPSVLPFCIMAQGLIYTGFCPLAERVFSPFFKLLKINSKCAPPFVTSLVAGYPVGCKMLCDMYKEGMITKGEAEEFLGFCNNGGIIFSLSVCGVSVFCDYKTGLLIFLVQVIAGLITAVILSGTENEGGKISYNKKTPLPQALGKAVSSGGGVLLNVISSFVVFYAVISAFSLEKIPLLCGITELTRGVMWAGEVGSVPLAAMFFSFGGLGVFSQCAAILADSGLKMKKMIIGKILTGIIAFLITWGVMYIQGIY